MARVSKFICDFKKILTPMCQRKRCLSLVRTSLVLQAKAIQAAMSSKKVVHIYN